MEERKDNLIRRYLVFLTGLAIAALGVAFSTKAGLGTTPVASVPYSVSLLLTCLSFGTWLNVLSIMQITAQVIILRGKCSKLEIGIQTVLAFAYGYLTDMWVYVIRNLSVDTYLDQVLYMLISCVVLGFGIWLQFRGGVAMLPGEALNRAIATVTGKKYANIKIAADVLMIAAAAVICLAGLGRLEGVREGSIFAAVAVGCIIKVFERIYQRIRAHLVK